MAIATAATCSVTTLHDAWRRRPGERVRDAFTVGIPTERTEYRIKNQTLTLTSKLELYPKGLAKGCPTGMHSVPSSRANAKYGSNANPNPEGPHADCINVPISHAEASGASPMTSLSTTFGERGGGGDGGGRGGGGVGDGGECGGGGDGGGCGGGGDDCEHTAGFSVLSKISS